MTAPLAIQQLVELFGTLAFRTEKADKIEWRVPTLRLLLVACGLTSAAVYSEWRSLTEALLLSNELGLPGLSVLCCYGCARELRRRRDSGRRKVVGLHIGGFKNGPPLFFFPSVPQSATSDSNPLPPEVPPRLDAHSGIFIRVSYFLMNDPERTITFEISDRCAHLLLGVSCMNLFER